MWINTTEIENTFAEAFVMWGARVLVTGKDEKWAEVGAEALTGFATSVIGCGCEAGIERAVKSDETPDGRPGVSCLLFARGREELGDQLVNRIGQAVMTAPTTACFDALEGDQRVPVGDKLRYFGDGFQISKRIGDKRYWRIPVMEGEFVVEDKFSIQKGVGGGNFILLSEDPDTALTAAEKAVEAIGGMKNVIMPFPGGIVRSGSKVGAKYKSLGASTNTPFCPTIKGLVKTQLPDEVNTVYELVIDGLDIESVKGAMRLGIEQASTPGIKKITSGNYGGRLGKYMIALQELFGDADG